jgi:tetratricopeptide (TPR) repeat protein
MSKPNQPQFFEEPPPSQSAAGSNRDPAGLTPAQAIRRAGAAYNSGQWASAERICRMILRVQADNFDALNLLGVIAAQTSRTEEAAGLLGRAAVARPNSADAHNNYGNVLKDLGRHDAALYSYERALKIRPDFAEVYNNLGIALQKLGRPDEAVGSYERALKINPGLADAHNHRGVALQALYRFEEALKSYDRALTVKPDYAEAYHNRGIALGELDRLDEALADFDRAIAIRPDYADAYYSKAFALLLRGDYENGWINHEWRWRAQPNALRTQRTFSQPLWLGDTPIAGRTILLHSEQGFGDTIQFCRYAKLVAALGATVILEVEKPLKNLLASVDGVAQVVAKGELLPAFSYHCPLMSLPLAFKTTVSTIPACVPYLGCDRDKALLWKQRFGGRRQKFRVGLVWAGAFRPEFPEHWSVMQRRNVPLAELAVLKHADIEFYSLQKGQRAESDLATSLAGNWDGPQINDFASLHSDFSDTAAMIENLDLVISVDTATAHLAGALGKPVWILILNRFDVCWRWLLGRSDSPWYPTARLYRQTSEDWHEVVQEVRSDLIRLVGESA